MTRTLRRTGQVLTALSAVSAVASLVQWQLADLDFSTFGATYRPMVPTTACLFILLSLTQFARHQWPTHPFTHGLSRLGGGVALGLAAWIYGQSHWSLPAPWDAWFRPSGFVVGSFTFGRMAPMTAAVFILISAATLAATSNRHAALRIHAALHGLCLLMVADALLAFAAGMPLLYGRQSMALVTGLTFVGLSGGALLGSPLIASWKIAGSPEPGEGTGRARSQRRYLVRLIAGSVVTAMAFLAAGVSYVRVRVDNARQSIWRELDSVVALKAGEIERWREDRRTDGRALQETADVREAVARLQTRAGDPAARRHLTELLSPLVRVHAYEAIQVSDAAGTVLLTVPDDAPLSSLPPPSTRGGIQLSGPDPSRGPHGDRLVVSVPLGDGGPAPSIALVMDLARNLYPTVRRWPTPTASAEALLVRKEGDEVVHLTQPGPSVGEAPGTRHSIREPFLAVAMAARGESSAREGVDGSGAAIITASQTVPNSDWILVARVDQAEVYGPIRGTARVTAIFGLLAVALTAFAAAYLWKERTAALLKADLEAREARFAVSERLALLMRSSNDLVFVIDDAGGITDFNDAVLRTYGYSADELRGVRLRELRADPRPEAAQEQLAQMGADEGALFESIHRRKDGSEFPVEVSAHGVLLGGRRQILAVCRDITERVTQRRHIGRLNGLYLALTQVNQAVVRAPDAASLLAESCRALADKAGFGMVWIGAPDALGERLRVLARHGDDGGYLDSMEISADLSPEAFGPAGTAIHEDRAEVRNDILDDAAMAPGHASAVRAGFQSCISVPLPAPGGARGVLTAYSREKQFFGDDEVALLVQAAADMGFGIESLEKEARRREAEETLGKVSMALEQTPVSIVITDISGHIEYVNPYFERITGYTKAEARGLNPRVLKSGETPAHEYAALWAKITAGETWEGEFHNRRKDGTLFWEHATIAPVRDANGRIRSFVAVKEDITQRRASEEALRSSEERHRLLAENASDVIWTMDIDGIFTYVSPSVFKRRGYRPEEIVGRPFTVSIDPAFAPLLEAKFHHLRAEALAGKEFSPFGLEVQQPCRDGSRIWTEVSVSSLVDDQGRFRGVLGVNRDISERKRAEAKLAARINELLHFQAAVVGREERMIELKREVNGLSRELDRAEPYPNV